MPTTPASLPLIDVIIPAHNEELSIGRVLAEIPRAWVRDIIVVDNASRDNTSAAARAGGATVLREDRPGYGWACLRGMAHCYARPAAEQWLAAFRQAGGREVYMILNPLDLPAGGPPTLIVPVVPGGDAAALVRLFAPGGAGDAADPAAAFYERLGWHSLGTVVQQWGAARRVLLNCYAAPPSDEPSAR